MSYMVDGYYGETAATAPVSERVAFIRRTYAHLTAAIAAFVALEVALIGSGVGQEILKQVFVGKAAWLGLMILFIGGSYAAQYMARSTRSVGMQYMGLSLYVLVQVIFFLPILTVAETFPQFAGKYLALKAGGVTLFVFVGLTAAVFWSKKDFSFMGPFLAVCSWVALGFVLVAVFFGGVTLGLVFFTAMIALAAGYIIYDTSNVMHHYGTDQHVAASLELFASVALMFYYVLRLFMSARDD